MEDKISDTNKSEPNVNSTNKKSSKLSTKVIIVLLFILICTISTLAAVCVKLYTEMQQKQIVEENKEKVANSSIVISDDSHDYVSDIKDKVENGMICIRMTQNWTFHEGGASSNAYLANSERNNFDLRFEISLSDTGEVIMTSPDVPVGSCIENFPLGVYLDPGQYDVIIAHQHIENGEVVNVVNTSATITVTD